MFEKFGEFDSYEEINRAAKAQLEEGDLEAIKTITEENGLDPEDAEDYCTGAIEELTTPSLAAMGKLELEAKDLSLTGALRDWTDFIEQLAGLTPPLYISIPGKAQIKEIVREYYLGEKK